MKFKQFIFGAFVYLAVLTVFIVVCNMVADAKAATIQPIVWKYAVASAYDDVGGPLACGGVRVAAAMVRAKYDDSPFGTSVGIANYANPITVHPSHHADDPHVYLARRNSLIDCTPNTSALDGMKLRDLELLRESMDAAQKEIEVYKRFVDQEITLALGES